jgi:septum site-determining protein MinD
LGKVIVVTSGKGGVGKTTTTANLAVALAKMGRRVVAIDGDIGLRNLDLVMGLENRIVYTLVDVVEGACRLNQAMVKDKRVDNLYMIPAAQTRTKDAVTAEQMEGLCSELREDFDYVLVDSPAGIEAGFRNAAQGADEALVVTTPEVSAVRDADRIIGLLESMGKAPIRLVINRIRPHMVKKKDMLSVDDVLEVLAVDLIGVVPDDESVVTSSNRGEPLTLGENSPAAMAFRDLAMRLEGQQVPFPTLEDESGKGIIAKFKRMFKG